jgi:FecR protein
MVDRPQDPGQLPQQPSDELLDLIWDLSEGDVDGDSVSRLNELMLASAANRAAYVQFLQVAAWLEYEQSSVPAMTSLSPSATASSSESDAGSISTEGCSHRSFVPDDAFSAVSVAIADPLSIRANTLRRRAMQWLTLAACGVLLMVVASYTLRDQKQSVEGIGADSQSNLTGEQLNIITIRLATAESRTLPIADFGTISVQGPAHLDLVGNTRARLYQGRIKVRIDDERGHGFVVETPNGQVTDLGTEFGVDVGDDSHTGVVVFRGAVDLAVPAKTKSVAPRVERLIQGEGLTVFDSGRRLDRIMSIITGNVSTFQRRGETRAGEAAPVIVDVWDNIRSAGFKSFYEIVPSGMREDALAYADRPQHEWNGVDATGMPPYLIGADYVKTFNTDKMRNDVELCVSLASPARLFVLLDDRVSPPAWLRASFRDTSDDIGLDCGPYIMDGTPIPFDHGTGPGKSVEVKFSVWERIVKQAGTIRLGPNSGATYDTGLYAVAAIPLSKEVPRGQGRNDNM